MVKLNKLEVEILQDANTAKEYEDSGVKIVKDSVTQYVEIKEGRPFIISFARYPDYECTLDDVFRVTVSVDGQRTGDVIVPKDSMSKKDGKFVALIEGFWKMLKGQEIFREFQFQEARLRFMRSNEDLNDLRQEFQEQGMICVEVSQCRGDIVPDNGDNLSDIEDEDAQYVVPKDVAKEKGSTSSASFNTIERPDTRESTFRILEERDVVKFQFKYRTIEALYDQQIVPRPEKDDTIPRAEFEALQREHEELKQKVKKEEAEKLAGSLKNKKKRNIIQSLEDGEIELIEERPAHRRKPNFDDVVIVLDD